MGGQTSAIADAPRWFRLTWLWLPAVAPLALVTSILLLQPGGPVLSWWTAAGLAGSVVFAIRERWPVPALGGALLLVASARAPGADVLGEGFDVAYLLVLFVPVLPLVAVASRTSVPWSVAAFVATAVVTLGVSPAPPWTDTALSAQARLVAVVLNAGIPVLIALGAWLAGFALLSRRRQADAFEERAISLERLRGAEAARAVAEERTRIARELHDVVTHTVAVMVVQAAAARAVWERDPEQAQRALEAVEDSGRTAMADLRGVLRTMRPDEVAEADAAPGLDQLGKLAEQVRATGLSCELTVTGPVDRLTPATSLSLLRIAQESVTNALRHAAASTIAVALAVDASGVRLSIADDGVGYDAAPPAADELDPLSDGGHGLTGMRERARVLGGTLVLGHRPAGKGTVVTVRAPLRMGAA